MEERRGAVYRAAGGLGGAVKVFRGAAGPLAAATLATAAWADCPAPAVGAQVINGGALQAAWQAEAGPILVGRPFALLVTLCPADAQLLRVDATMPDHRHGMNYRASIKALGDGRWRVEGLLWHMSGRWELSLDLQSQGQAHRLRQSVTLP